MTAFTIISICVALLFSTAAIIISTRSYYDMKHEYDLAMLTVEEVNFDDEYIEDEV